MDLELYQKIRESPWEFARHCVFTQDQADRANPIKAFPDFEYLQYYFKAWQKYRLLAVPKSRRMMLSWSTVILYLWDTMFHIGRQNAFVSKKEADGDELIERCKFILDNIPKDKLPPSMIPKWKKTYCTLEFPEINSKIMSFPSGSDQLRQFGFSGIMGDECAFWEDAESMYSSTFPTIEATGRMTMISSPAPGFFKNLVFDQMDGNTGQANAQEKQHIYPMQGLEIWKNPKNKFVVFQLHYSANPNKDKAYIENIKSSMPKSQFMQEFELQWESFEGQAVYPDWNERFHGVKESLQPHVGLPLLLGVDQGLTPACVVAQLQGDQLVILKEITAVNMGAERFCDLVKRELAVSYPAWCNVDRDFILFMDPAGFSRKDTDERTYASIWSTRGFKPTPGAMTWEERRQSVEHFLLKVTKSGPSLQVSLPNCQLLVRGFNGGYRYPDKAFEIEPNKIRPLKDEHSHIHDALQYLCSSLVKKRRFKKQATPPPYYSWSARKNTYGVSQ